MNNQNKLWGVAIVLAVIAIVFIIGGLLITIGGFNG